MKEIEYSLQPYIPYVDLTPLEFQVLCDNLLSFLKAHEISFELSVIASYEIKLLLLKAHEISSPFITVIHSEPGMPDERFLVSFWFPIGNDPGQYQNTGYYCLTQSEFLDYFYAGIGKDFLNPDFIYVSDTNVSTATVSRAGNNKPSNNAL